MRLVKNFRVMNSLYKKKVPIIPDLIRKYIRIVYSCELPYTVVIGDNTTFAHNGLGVVVNEHAIIGNNVSISHNVTIGGRNGRGRPVIEDDVFVGPGACILGGVTVGKGAFIGANAVVIHDVPENSLVVTPLAIIKEKKNNY
ncbi:MAG: serine O-acetyltransferase [Dysgonomonas sp.]